MTLAAYTGHEALTFPDYLDLDTGKTLSAEPGGTYDVAPASGRLVPDIPAGWFAPAVEASGGLTLTPSSISGEARAEAAAEQEPGEDPETGEPE